MIVAIGVVLGLVAGSGTAWLVVRGRVALAVPFVATVAAALGAATWWDAGRSGDGPVAVALNVAALVCGLVDGFLVDRFETRRHRVGQGAVVVVAVALYGGAWWWQGSEALLVPVQTMIWTVLSMRIALAWSRKRLRRRLPPPPLASPAR